MIKIFLVDDHKIIRDGIRSYLENDLQYEVKGEAESGEEALKYLADNQIDIVLMDISMNQMDGIKCTEEIRKRFPGIKIIGLSMLKESIHIKKLIKAGASGYLLKNCNENDIKRAINAVHNGETYYGREVMQKIMDDFSSDKKNKGASSKSFKKIILTNREKEILHLIVNEYSNQEIAGKLFISTRTVEAHKRNLLEKTNARNIAGLVKIALQYKLVDE